MPQPKSRAARKAALSRATPAPVRAKRNPYQDALAVACEQCGVKYTRLPAPRTMEEFRLVTSPTALTTYAERDRRDRVPNSYDVLTQDDGRWDGAGMRQEWDISTV
jgi:hypothetical protein